MHTGHPTLLPALRRTFVLEALRGDFRATNHGQVYTGGDFSFPTLSNGHWDTVRALSMHSC
jgi:hypothetical protein